MRITEIGVDRSTDDSIATAEPIETLQTRYAKRMFAHNSSTSYITSWDLLENVLAQFLIKLYNVTSISEKSGRTSVLLTWTIY
jgi:hypothetical protein